MNTAFIRCIWICSLLFTLLSCEKDSELEEKLVGKWSVEFVEGNDGLLPFHPGDILTLNSDKNFTLSPNRKGTWTVYDKQLEMVFDNKVDRFIGKVEKSGSRMKIYKTVEIHTNSWPEEITIYSIRLKLVE